MKNIILTIFFLISPILSYAFSGDSVMNTPTLSGGPSLQYQGASASSGNIYSYTTVIQYQTSICPIGLTVSSTGSTIYNSAQRIITTTYLGTQIVGTNTGSWIDIDTDCVGTQYQTIACPAGYNGIISQSRKIGTGVGGYVYGDWITYSNTCAVADPSSICLQAAKGLFPSFYFVSIYVQSGYTGNGVASTPGTVVDLSGSTTSGGANLGIIACYFDSKNTLDELIAPGVYIGQSSSLRYLWYFNNFNGTGYN